MVSAPSRDSRRCWARTDSGLLVSLASPVRASPSSALDATNPRNRATTHTTIVRAGWRADADEMDSGARRRSMAASFACRGATARGRLILADRGARVRRESRSQCHTDCHTEEPTDRTASPHRTGLLRGPRVVMTVGQYKMTVGQYKMTDGQSSRAYRRGK